MLASLVLTACSGESSDGVAPGDLSPHALTTAAADAAADPACDASSISWSDPSATDEACRGPWEYERYPACRIASPTCGPLYCPPPPAPRRLPDDVVVLDPPVVRSSGGSSGSRATRIGRPLPPLEPGPQWATCTSWDFGHTIQTESTTSAEQAAPYSCRYYPPPVRVACSVNVGEANATCMAAAQARAHAIRAGLPAAVHGFVRVVSATAVITRYPSPSVGAAMTCTSVIEYPQAITRADPACGCAVPMIYPTCDLRNAECGPSTRVTSAPGLSYEALTAGDPTGAYDEPDDRAPLCTSAEHVSADTPEGARRKYEILRASWDRHPASRPTYARNLRQLYELRGDVLLPEQRELVRSLYADFPTPLACGVPGSSPIPLECGSSDAAAVGAALTRCGRLAGAHVPGTVAAIELESCADALVTATALDDDCGGPAARDALRESLTTMIARSLSLIERPAAEQTDQLGALARQLYLIDRWDAALDASYAVEGPELRAEQRAIRSEVVGRFWRHAQASRAVLSDLAGAGAQVEDALEEATARGLTLDRDVLVAAHTPIASLPAITAGATIEPAITLGRPPAQGAILLLVTGDALTGLTDRLEDLGVFHDFACQFARCEAAPTPTRLARFYAVLAALDSSSTLAAELDALPSSETLDGWRAAFAAMRQGHGTFGPALSEAGLELPIASADALAIAPEALAIARIVLDAERRIAAFSSTGLLDPIDRRTLFAGVEDRQRAVVMSSVREAMSRLEDDARDYEHDLATVVAGVLSEVGTAESLERIHGERVRLARQMDLAVDDIAGLQASASAEDVRYGTLAAAVTGLDGALDSGQFVPVGDTLHLSLDGTAALYEGGAPDVDEIDVGVVHASAGEVVGIATSGLWSPVCALNGTDVQLEDGVIGPFDATGTVIGPEGFTLVVANGQTRAESASHQSTSGNEKTVGASVRACVSFGTPARKVTGWGASVEGCVYGDIHQSWGSQSSEGWSNESSTSWSSQFSSGLRLPNTPAPMLPAGALVVVEMAPGETSPSQVRDVHVVRAPYTAITLSEAADLYLVANDTNCGAARDTIHSLGVDVRRFRSQTALAAAVTMQMEATLAAVRSLEPVLVAQGSILPAQLGAMRSEAVHALNTRTGVPYTSLPAPLAGMFEAFLDREIVRLERAVQIASLERHLDASALELELLRREELLVERHGRLSQLVPGWTLRNLDGDRLRSSARDLVTLSRRHLYPVLDLWYPEALDELDVASAAAPLLAAGPQVRTLDLVSDVRSILDATLSRLSAAAPGYKETPHRPLVAVSFVRPDIVPGPFTPVSSLPKADVQRASVLWTDVADLQTARITIRPEDVYARYGGAGGLLACTEAVPVIQRMALYVVRPGGATDTLDLNDEQRWLTGRASVTQPFAEESGPVVYTLGNASWQQFQIPILYGSYTGALSTFVERALGSSSTVLPEGAVGLSPFGEIEIDFQGLAALRDGTLGDGVTTPGLEATEIVLVMQVDSRSTAARLSWVPQCSR